MFDPVSGWVKNILNLIDPEALSGVGAGEIPSAGMPESWQSAGGGTSGTEGTR